MASHINMRLCAFFLSLWLSFLMVAEALPKLFDGLRAVNLTDPAPVSRNGTLVYSSASAAALAASTPVLYKSIDLGETKIATTMLTASASMMVDIKTSSTVEPNPADSSSVTLGSPIASTLSLSPQSQTAMVTAVPTMRLSEIDAPTTTISTAGPETSLSSPLRHTRIKPMKLHTISSLEPGTESTMINGQKLLILPMPATAPTKHPNSTLSSTPEASSKALKPPSKYPSKDKVGIVAGATVGVAVLSTGTIGYKVFTTYGGVWETLKAVKVHYLRLSLQNIAEIMANGRGFGRGWTPSDTSSGSSDSTDSSDFASSDSSLSSDSEDALAEPGDGMHYRGLSDEEFQQLCEIESYLMQQEYDFPGSVYPEVMTPWKLLFGENMPDTAFAPFPPGYDPTYPDPPPNSPSLPSKDIEKPRTEPDPPDMQMPEPPKIKAPPNSPVPPEPFDWRNPPEKPKTPAKSPKLPKLPKIPKIDDPPPAPKIPALNIGSLVPGVPKILGLFSHNAGKPKGKGISNSGDNHHTGEHHN